MLIDVKVSEIWFSLKAVVREWLLKNANILMDNFFDVFLVFVGKDGIWPDCYQLDVRRRKRITAVSKRLKRGQAKKVKKRSVHKWNWQKRDQNEEKKKGAMCVCEKREKWSFEQEREEGAKRSLWGCQNNVEKERLLQREKGF
jgi:hypothetical protein